MHLDRCRQAATVASPPCCIASRVNEPNGPLLRRGCVLCSIPRISGGWGGMNGSRDALSVKSRGGIRFIIIVAAESALGFNRRDCWRLLLGKGDEGWGMGDGERSRGDRSVVLVAPAHTRIGSERKRPITVGISGRPRRRGILFPERRINVGLCRR